MNKKAFLPLLILIPLVIVGLIAFYFILKAVIGIVLTTIMWTIGLVFVIIAGFVIYYIIKFALSQTNKKSK